MKVLPTLKLSEYHNLPCSFALCRFVRLLGLLPALNRAGSVIMDGDQLRAPRTIVPGLIALMQAE